jgi:hypothetical protein
MGKRYVDECGEHFQGLATVHWPSESRGRIVAETPYAGIAYRLPEQCMVMQRPPINGFRRLSAPRLAVFGIEVPLAAHRTALGLEQHAMFAAHVPVKILHAPLLLAGKQIPRFETVGEEVHAGGFSAIKAASGEPGIELRIQAVFIRGLPFKTAGLGFGQQGIDIFSQVLTVFWGINGDVMHTMSS